MPLYLLMVFMPRRTGRIRVRIVDPVLKAEKVVYLGEEHRKNSRDRRVVSDRRAMPSDFLKSVVLGRRHAGMSDAEIADAKSDHSGKRSTFLNSKIGNAMPHEFGFPVQQTTRRASTTRRQGFPRRRKIEAPSSFSMAGSGILAMDTRPISISPKNRYLRIITSFFSNPH